MFSSGTNYFSEEHYTFIEYGKEVKKIVIEDKLAKFGITGYIDVENTGEHLNFILDRLNCYHLVIYIRVKENENIGIRFEPYILNIDSVSNIVESNGGNKQVLRLHFMDEFTYIAMQHSMATVVKYCPNITKRSSYREVFGVIMDYFKRFTKVNYNGLYGIKKDLLYAHDYTHESADVSSLITNSFRKMDPTCTVYEGMQILLRDAGSPILSNIGFKSKYNDFDYMLVPLFFKEEYADLYSIYQHIYDPIPKQITQDKSSNSSGSEKWYQKVVGDTGKGVEKLTEARKALYGDFNDKKTNEKFMELERSPLNKLANGTQFKMEGMQICKNFNETQDVLIMRPMTLRDVHMPFNLCFQNGGDIIFESINPTKIQTENGEEEYTKSELKFHTLNGRKELALAKYRYYPTNQNLVQKLWKNMIICNTGQQDGAGSVSLIEFNWIYQYYIYNFLGYGTGKNEGYTSNITPSFFLAQKSDRITDSTLLSDFYEMNANFQMCRSSSDLNEALILIGKNLTSFVTQNDTYQFTIRGDIFRHPNEIIKVSNNTSVPDNNPAVSIHTDLVNNSYILMYITSVSHIWEGSSYRNEVSANKIYERLVNDTAEEK